MKKMALTLLVALAGINVLAQDAVTTTQEPAKQEAKRGNCPGFYITTGTGINNNTGIVGFSFDVPVSEKVSIDAGPGTGTWGSKLYAGVKYYLQPCHRGFAFGTGLTYCPGVQRDNANLTNIYGYTQNIEYNKNPLTYMLFAAYKYWTLGKKYNRVYMELGWTSRIGSGDMITQLNGEPMSSRSRNQLDSWGQGGPILAAGFSFGVR